MPWLQLRIHNDDTPSCCLEAMSGPIECTGVKQCTFHRLISIVIVQKQRYFNILIIQYLIIITCIRYENVSAICLSVHGISIGVLNKLMKCATKTQSLLASTPCSHKNHMIALVTVHDFSFQLSMTSLMNCEAFTTMKMAVQPVRVHAIQNTRATIVAQGHQ